MTPACSDVTTWPDVASKLIGILGFLAMLWLLGRGIKWWSNNISS